MIIAYYAKLRHKCGDAISCQKANEALEAISSMSTKIDRLHGNAAASDAHMNSIRDSHSAFDSNLADIKADMALLQGIIMGINSGAQNKRIIHEK
jgi:phage shock protein A